MRYQGGKSRIAKPIAQIIMQAAGGDCFVSLFCGSCAVESKVQGFSRKILNDRHEYLIAMLQGVQQGYNLPEHITPEQYQYIRENKDADPVLAGFVGFGCSFGGKWFGGYARNKTGTNYAEQSKRSLLKDMATLQDAHFANTGKKSFDGTKVKIIFDRDVLINETEVINNCKASVGILSDETIVKMHPWVSDPEQELKRIKDEKEEAMADPYRTAFEQNRNPQQPGTVKDGEDGGQTE